MTEFPKDAKFIYSWRKYQQRVLNELDNHLKDRHLHVIAPPGSGKTVLGLEVVLRLNKPTLILAPTIALKDQWIQRFCELFLQTHLIPDWISRDICNPKFMTVATYQGLHAACNNFQREEYEIDDDELDENEYDNSNNQNLSDIVEGLREQNIKTIVADEAHHLKNGWWQTLSLVKEKLNPVIVGLTATPPYDVSYPEWQRYLEFNGPVDTEIAVPELVIEGDLCPHQDYVYFTSPTKDEYNHLKELRQRIEKLFSEIKNDEVLIKAIESNPIWINPHNNLDWIYDNLFITPLR
jgi:superfamily II DNA or RNA helicase